MRTKRADAGAAGSPLRIMAHHGPGAGPEHGCGRWLSCGLWDSYVQDYDQQDQRAEKTTIEKKVHNVLASSRQCVLLSVHATPQRPAWFPTEAVMVAQREQLLASD
jgi:hypothetical protein